jgi:hypothetical protein
VCAARFVLAALLSLLCPTAADAALLEAPGGIRVHFQPHDSAAARRAAAETREISDDIERRIGVAPPAPLDVHIAENDAAFNRIVGALAAGAEPPAWALAVAIPGAKAVVIRASRLQILTWNDLRPTLAHELAHLALGRVGPIPRWFNEGLAEWAAGRRLSQEERTLLERLAHSGDLPSLEDLARSFPPHAAEAQVSYLVSLAFVESLADDLGARTVPELVRRIEAGEPFDRAFERAFDAPLRGYELTWRVRMAERYSLARDLWERASLLTVAAILVICAFIRYLFKRRKLLQSMPDLDSGPEEEPNRIP